MVNPAEKTSPTSIAWRSKSVNERIERRIKEGCRQPFASAIKINILSELNAIIGLNFNKIYCTKFATFVSIHPIIGISVKNLDL